MGGVGNFFKAIGQPLGAIGGSMVGGPAGGWLGSSVGGYLGGMGGTNSTQNITNQAPPTLSEQSTGWLGDVNLVPKPTSQPTLWDILNKSKGY